MCLAQFFLVVLGFQEAGTGNMYSCTRDKTDLLARMRIVEQETLWEAYHFVTTVRVNAPELIESSVIEL